MAIIVLLIIVSLLIAVGFLISFLWTMKSGQYDDMYSPAVRMLFDDKIKDKPVTINNEDGKHATNDSTTKEV
jgi:cbb3-type cytochrome oxidase maturation protein